MKITGDDVSAGKHADCSTCTNAAVGRAELALGSRQYAIDFILHRPERQPALRFMQSRCILIVDVEGFAADNVQPRPTFADSRKFLNAPIEKTPLLGIKTLHTDP